MDDTALLELPDDPVLLKCMIAERDGALAQRDARLIEREQTLAQRDAVLAQRDESIQLLSQDNQLLRHRLAIEHDLDESAKACPCCGEQRQRIGRETSEQLEHLPCSFVVLEHIRHKYACAHCNSGGCQKCDGQAHVDLATKPPPPIEKGPAGPGLLAYVVTGKLADHLPLYRLEQIFTRQKVDISRSTLCGWIAAAARVVEPLYQLPCERARQSEVMHADDTTAPILHEGHCRQGRPWTCVGDESNPYVAYDYTPTRSGQGPLGRLGPWKGFLQADAYAGYDKLHARGDVIEAACWAHARRKFFDAQESDPARAPWMLEMIRLWLIGQQARVLPRSPIAAAIGYALNQWPALAIYATDARLSIDNNVAERALRRVAVGRKNRLFAGHDESAQAHAVLWSLIASAQRHGIDPQFYPRSVLAHLPDLPPEKLQNYLPDAWKRDLMAEQQAALNDHHAGMVSAAIR